MDNAIRTIYTSVATTTTYILKSSNIILDYTTTTNNKDNSSNIFTLGHIDNDSKTHLSVCIKHMKTHITQNKKSTTTIYSSIRDQWSHCWLAFSHTFKFVLNWLILVHSPIWTGIEFHSRFLLHSILYWFSSRPSTRFWPINFLN